MPSPIHQHQEQASGAARRLRPRRGSGGRPSADCYLGLRLNPAVEVDTGRAGPLTVVRVANSGPPIRPDQVAALFEPFRRLGGDRTGSARGAGLGLSIVRSVATAHGGQAEARALPGGGLEGTVGLPAG